MIKRPLIAAALAAGVALPAAVGHWSPAQAARRRPSVSIGRATVNPRSLPGSGGTVSIQVSVRGLNGAVVNSVSARSTVSGTSPAGPSATLQRSSGNNFTGSVRIPRNTRSSKVTAYIDVDVSSSAGPFSKRRAAKVTLGAAVPGSDGPPPPPDI